MDVYLCNLSVNLLKKRGKEKGKLCNLFVCSHASAMKWLLLLLSVFHVIRLNLSNSKLNELFTFMCLVEL